ncbi:class I SAM-dependent methyltransferase [Aeromicrobium sp. UC242_57]|uniref:class I SAM-dependent methyltransferase n=1 Tax=Aeromicrobium sp. UC242_57 TaxID=3374624 RepID=UPI0037AA084E
MTQIATARWPGIAHTPRTPLKARAAKAILKPTVNRIPVQVSFADGTRWGAVVRTPRDADRATEGVFARLGAESKIGLGEAYMAGDWNAAPGTDLADLLSPFADRMAHLVPEKLQTFRAFVDQKLPHHQRNSVAGSRKNIEAHYDLSNDLFTQFLDPSMSYSAAWFESPTQSLEDAQMRKIDGILDQAHVGAGTRMLEIGSGWGALAIRAAQRGAKVTTITISKEQAVLAEERFAEAGVDVDLQLVDYREVTGEYDAIVSVEMIEAVGEEYWPTYFATIDKLLAPGGHVSIQAITMAHHRYLATRNSYGWIQKYIFPGGLIPSLEAIDATLAEHTSLAVTDRRSLGLDYAQTLQQWRDRFNANWDAIRSQGFDETFRRMWEFYLAYCQAGFSVGYIDVFQIQMSRPTEG